MWWYPMPIIFYNLWWLITFFLKLHTIHVQKQGRCTLEIILTWLEILNWSLLPPMLNTSPPQFLTNTNPKRKGMVWFSRFFFQTSFRDFKVMSVFRTFYSWAYEQKSSQNLLLLKAGPFILTKVVHLPSPRVQMVEDAQLMGRGWQAETSKSPCRVFLIHGN